MSKIIKPKLNPDGSPVIDFVRFNDWYFSNIFDELLQWKIEHQSSDSKMPIYYAEEWRPKKSETYFYYHLQKERAFETKMYNDDTDTYNLKFENYSLVINHCIIHAHEFMVSCFSGEKFEI